MNCIDEHYKDLLQTILDYGVEKKDRTGTGTKSIFGYTIRHKMSDGFPLLTTKKMAWKTMVTELLWFLRGDTNIKYLVDNNCHIWDGDAYKNYLKHYKVLAEDLNKWQKENMPPLTQEQFIDAIKTDNEFAKQWGDLGPIYGKQWRSWENYNGLHLDESIDQIQNLINDLKTNSDSRRLMVNAWNVSELDEMVLPPCHYGFQVYTRELTWEEQTQWVMKNTNVEWENVYIVEEVAKPTTPKRAISLMWNQRSVDVFLGLPFNIASYGLLLEIIAKVVNMIPEHLVGHLGDTHLYNNHIEQAKEQISREPFELPTLNINTEFWQTESGECGVGPISTSGFISGLSDDNFCKCLLEDIQLTNYQSHPAIKAPLSN
jgi:thymidylate synthase